MKKFLAVLLVIVGVFAALRGLGAVVVIILKVLSGRGGPLPELLGGLLGGGIVVAIFVLLGVKGWQRLNRKDTQ